MSTPTLFVGIDISKEKLEVYFQNKSFELLNRPAPLAKFMHQLLELEVPVQIICEASGGYEEALLQSAHHHGVPICCVQPLRVRQFALSKGLLAKNDRLDARLLADFGQSIQPRLTAPTSALQKQIGELLTFSRLLIEQRTAVSNELEHFHSAQACRLVQKVLKSLQTQIERISQKIKALIAKDTPMAQRIQRLCSIKGVGFQTALSLSCLLPEIGLISTKQLAALVSVAPFVRDSGPRCAKRSIRGGRAKLRSQLYMVALIRKLLIAMHYVLKKPSLVPS